ncbi:hypothetical protein PR249_00960 [Metamycoplasma hyosynoviae]|uniref:hypothetical protein n=1 Tax=Metamycoplasma hyosynoviae TaxID=29559 RepID=UPI00235910BA|nr:hypothetical protein [Metamycoplasma hyosynoviae]MDC8900852.1 hypothetical protein [Metamycoplasma hyosynoviae]MDC8912465.1 hypothetical protein [Metamycoplasma hyosynoviae]MDC8912878.1 hypothetical protein [Metamycoplasma hyosynoviae]MDC8915016.1 hypothetical protein [Metamycoplasma hyosynoviae]MDD1374945.1 hypothetical protein [Metamycoplasma hyosynoviae]
MFKLNEQTFTFDKVDNSKFYEELNKNAGESSYFSFEGTWLFCSIANNSISNFKLVKIVDVANDLNELLKYNNKFYSKISKYSDGEIVPFWKTEFGVKMMFWLIQNKKKPQEEILKAKYEDIIEYYKEYVNYLFNHNKEEYIIKPTFKNIEDNKLFFYSKSSWSFIVFENIISFAF